MADKNRKATLKVAVDPTGAEAGFAKVRADAKDMAQAVVKAGQDAAKGFEGVGAGAEKLSKTQASVVENIKRQSIAAEQGRVGLAAYKAEYYGVTDAVAPFIAKMREADRGQIQLGMSAKATAAALRGVPAQFTDIVTSLQGGQAPLTVFLQQGGQLKDMFGGAGNAARALGGYVMGLIGPVTIAAATIGVLGFALNAGSGELREFQKESTLTGNAIGVSASQFAALRDGIAGVAGTKGKAAEVLTEIAANGKIASGEIRAIAEAAILMEKATGQATSKTIGQFAELAKSPAEASAKLNEQYNFLTASVYRQIKALEEQGKATEAANLAESTYAGALKTRANIVIDSAGTIEKAWRSITGVAKGAWDAMLGVGRTLTPSEKVGVAAADVARIQAQISGVGAFASTGGGAALGGASAARTAALQNELEAAKQVLATATWRAEIEQRKTVAKAEQNRLNQLGIAFEKQGDEFKTKAQKRTEEINKATIEGQQLVKAGLLTEKELRERIANISLKFNETTGQSEVAAIKARILAQQQYLETLRSQGAVAKDLTEGEKLVIKIRQELTTSITGVARAEKLKALAAAEGLAVVDKQVEGEKRRQDGLKKSEESYNRLIDETNKTADALGKQADELEASNAAWGKGKVAVEQYRLALVQAKLAEVEGGSDSSYSPAYVAELRRVAAEQARKVAGEQLAEYKDLAKVQRDYAAQIAEEANIYRDELALVGLTRLEREKAVAVRRVEIKLAKDLFDIENSAVTPERKAELVAMANANAVAAKSSAVAKVVQDDWQRTSDEINKGLTDALMRGFESGKGFAENFVDTLKNMVNTLVLRPVISAVLSPISGAISSVTNGLLGGGGGSGGIGSLSNLSSLTSIFGAGATAGASTASLVAANTVGALGGDALGTLIAANGSWSGVAAGATSAATAATGLSSALGAIGTAMPYIGLALAAYSILDGVGAFGGERQTTGSGISGTLRAGGSASVSNYSSWKQDGGWFGSDKSGTDYTPISAGLQQTLDGATMAMTMANKGYAEAIGLSADAVDGFVQSINLSLEGLDQQAQQDAINKVLSDFGDAMVSAAYGGALSAYLKAGETMGAALARLATSLTAANNWLEYLRQGLFDVSVAGADAASKLVDAFGGLDKYKAASKAYYDAYFTEAEKAADSTREMTEALEAVGLALPASKAALRETASGLDLTTDAGRKAYAVLVSLAPTFATTFDSLVKIAGETADKLLKTFSKDTIDFAGLSVALQDVNAQAFTATMAKVFDSLAERLTGVLGAIATERTAVASAIAGLNGPTVLTPSQITAGIAGSTVGQPTNMALLAAQTALAGADGTAAAAAAAVAAVKATVPSSAAVDVANTNLAAAKAFLNASQAEVDRFRGMGNASFNNAMNMAFNGQSNGAPYGSGEYNAQVVVRELLRAQAGLPIAQAARDAALEPYTAALADYSARLAAAQAVQTSALNAQTAAAAAARDAQVAYIASLQAYAIDASKATEKLGKLRDETLKYYEQQKALVSLMSTSAAGLRAAMLGVTLTGLNAGQTQTYQQGQFDQNFALASVSTGEVLAGYADKLAQVIPALGQSLKDSSGSALDYALSIARVNAQAATVAAALENGAAANTYEADSIMLLGQIDAALAALEAGSKSAERIIADAIKAGSDQTADGLRAVIAALTGQAIPAFASGGYHGGGLRLVGENGPELEATGPSRIWSSSETNAMLAGGNTGEVLAELKALRSDNRAQASAIVQLQTRLTKVIERWDATGIPEERVIA